MAHTSLDDGILIDLIARQDAGALGALYDRHSRLVYSIAAQLLDDARRAEDVTLDVFTRLWECAASYDPARAKVRTWIVGMARSRAIDVLRRSEARPADASVLLADASYQLAADDAPLEARVGRALEAERIQKALACLPAEQQHVITLACLRGYTQQEIADTLGLPPGTVRLRVRRGMEGLRRALAGKHADPASGSPGIIE